MIDDSQRMRGSGRNEGSSDSFGSFGHAGFGHGPRGRGHGGARGRGGWQQGDLPDAADAPAWFAGRLPRTWFATVEVIVDREEICVIGVLNEESRGGAEAEGVISRFRSETKTERIAIAQEAERRFGRRVAWGARLGETSAMFTHLAVPVMTRLRQPERQVLDTLVDSGVARSRSDALAWCVRLTGEHAQEWLGDLREAMSHVDDLRAKGPGA